MTCKATTDILLRLKFACIKCSYIATYFCGTSVEVEGPESTNGIVQFPKEEALFYAIHPLPSHTHKRTMLFIKLSRAIISARAQLKFEVGG